MLSGSGMRECATLGLNLSFDQEEDQIMIANKHFPLKLLIVALATAAGGCATNTPSQQADWTYCAKYGNAPECGGVQPPAPVAAAPAPAPAPAEPAVVVSDMGPPSKPGECYTKVYMPAQFRDEPVQEMVRPASERSEYSEPVYEEVEERVMVKPAWKKVTVVPAEYGQVEEKVLVREAYKREIEIPALYNTYFEKTLEKPARQVWKPGRGTVEKVDPNTGEILCLVEEEAVYKTVERKELARAASKTYQDVPAEYATVTKTVVTKPESLQEVEMPAVYETHKVTKLVKAPEQKKVVLCDVNATPERIEKVENALKAQGYPVTPSEGGKIDPQLTEYVRSFQEKNGMQPTGLLTADTLAALGVELQ
jgi:hypothetical protein